MMSSLQLLEDIIENKLDLNNPDNELNLDGGTIKNAHMYEIEGFQESYYKISHDVKHLGFLKNPPSPPPIDNRVDISIIDKVMMKQTKDLNPKRFDQRCKGYDIGEKGGVKCINPSEIKSQEGLMLEVMGRAGKSLVEGRGIVGISLPVKIFEPKSTLERATNYFNTIPIYIKKASLAQDPLERFKLWVTFTLSSFWGQWSQKKPFNPIIGETFQGFWEDGTSINFEHTSHNPPIFNYFIEDVDKRFKVYGRHELVVKVKGNNLNGHNFGPNVIEFTDGTKVEYWLPPGVISGAIYGTRVMSYSGKYKVTDAKNDFEAEITLEEPGGSFSSVDPDKINRIIGTIYKKSSPSTSLGKIEGSWTSFVKIDGVEYWNLLYVDPCRVV